MDLGELKTAKGKKRRAERFAQLANEVINTNYTKLGNVIRSDAKRLARLESLFSHELLNTMTGPSVDIGTPLALSTEMVSQIVELEPIDGLRHSRLISGLKSSVKFSLQKQLQIGMFQGESTEQLIRRVRGTKANGFRDGVFTGASKNSIERIVRTTITHVSNRARLETFKQHKDITTSYEFVATLDERTTPVCIKNDGKTFLYSDARGLLPPLHTGCRSTVIAIINWKGIGVEPPNRGTRATDEGQVSSKETYKTWLKKQSAEKQNRILGPTKAKWFRQGKVTLDDLVRRDGRSKTIAQLEQELFKRN